MCEVTLHCGSSTYKLCEDRISRHRNGILVEQQSVFLFTKSSDEVNIGYRIVIQFSSKWPTKWKVTGGNPG